jgi:ribokinase
VRQLSPQLAGNIDVLVVNAIEAAGISGRSVGGPDDAVAAARLLAKHFPHVVVTLGGDGVVYAGADSEPFALPAIPVVVASTHGAGDEFIGVLSVCLARGKDMRAALTAANAAAAKLVSAPEHERH